VCEEIHNPVARSVRVNGIDGRPLFIGLFAPVWGGLQHYSGLTLATLNWLGVVSIRRWTDHRECKK